MGHFRQIDLLPTLSACRFAPIASEPSHRSDSTRCANNETSADTDLPCLHSQATQTVWSYIRRT